ncbi:MAG: hypothetical protein JRJ44_04630 [Deltaproteobacteria bacterium]|nr:hypothetical protein [Deltaproteobacteria bacterium]
MFDEKDAYYDKKLAKKLAGFKIIIPYPILYLTLRTKFVKNKFALLDFKKFLKSDNIKYLNDKLYRDEVLERSFESSLKKKRHISVVGWLLRLIIDASKNKTDCLFTVNLRDFIDITRPVEILDIRPNIKS